MSEDDKRRSARPKARRDKGAPAARPSVKPAEAPPSARKPAVTKPAKPSAKSAKSAQGRVAARRPITPATPMKPIEAEPAAAPPAASEDRISDLPPPGIHVGREELEVVAEADVPHGASGVDEQIFDIEKRLEKLLEEADALAGDEAARRKAATALSQLAQKLGSRAPGGVTEDDDARMRDQARTLLGSDYYMRQWGRMAMRSRSEEVDDFGLDPTFEARLVPLFEQLYRRYFRVQTAGVANLPPEGAALIVCNHGGAVPWDGVMLKMAVRLEHPSRKELRWLSEDFVFHMPFLGAFMNRIGAVRACPENAARLLQQERLVAVFPEGIKGLGKPFKQRYQLQRFGRGGYVKLALRMGVPIVPCAIVGSEEANPLLFKLTWLTKGVGLPFLPVTPTFPWLGPLGLAPLPSRWRIVFGEPIDLRQHGESAADDAVLVNRLNEKVRSTIQTMLDGALEQRGSAYL